MKACRGVDRQCLLDINRYEFDDLMFEEAFNKHVLIVVSS